MLHEQLFSLDDAVSDAEPIVLDPDDPAFAAVTEGPAMAASDVLTPLMRRSAAALATATSAQDYLRSVGLTVPDIWDTFRLGAGHASLVDGLDAAAWETLDGLGLVHGLHRTLTLAKVGGLNLPTYDPRDPERVVGVIRLTPAQNLHHFATPPAGIACARSITTAPRVVLVDTPFLGMRLAQAGVAGVAIVENPEVLPPLHGWLAGRELIVASYRQSGIAAMQGALAGCGIAAQSLVMKGVLAQSGAKVLGILGLDRATLEADLPAADLTTRILADLHTYACDRIAAGVGNEALRTLEAEHPDLLRAYRVGFLPADYQDAMGQPARRALRGRRLGNTLVMPAMDEHGVIVDLLAIHVGTSGRGYEGCFPEPRGLLGAHLLGTTDRLIVTDTFRWLARLVAQGYGNTLLLRGAEDARPNAARIVAAGVANVTLRVRREAATIAQILESAGLRVVVETETVTGDDWIATPPVTADELPSTALPAPIAAAPPAVVLAVDHPQPVVVPAEPILALAPTAAEASVPAAAEAPVSDPALTARVNLVDFSPEKHSAVCEVGPLRYVIEVADGDLPTRQVIVRRGQISHQDRINPDVPAQCRRFAASAGKRLGIEAQRVEAHVAESWRLVREQEARRDDLPAITVTGNDRTEAETLLRDSNLLRHIEQDMAAMGWIGEQRAKGMLYLTAVSRLLPDPLWSVYRATTGGAPWKSLGIIAALMPPEECVVFTRLTESLLRRTDQRALRHRLLLIDRAETLRPEGAIALRCLREWGGIGWQQVAQAEGVNGAGILGEAKGPVAVLAAAVGDLDPRCRDSFVTVTVDESPEQTARVLTDQRRLHGRGGIPADQAQAIIRRHHALQRLLRPGTVVIPFGDRIAFPMTSVRHRDEQAAFLTLIEASALLHQFQRSRDAAGAVVASEADFHHAVAVAGHLLGASGDGLSTHGRHLLQRLFATRVTEFTLSDLGGLIVDWTYYTYRATAEELVAMGYCSAEGGGQGRKRQYTLVARRDGAVGIALLPEGSGRDTTEPCDLANVRRGTSQGASPSIMAG